LNGQARDELAGAKPRGECLDTRRPVGETCKYQAMKGRLVHVNTGQPVYRIRDDRVVDVNTGQPVYRIRSDPERPARAGFRKGPTGGCPIEPSRASNGEAMRLTSLVLSGSDHL
jgi:hypothetical protein